MGGANNAVGMIQAYMLQGTAQAGKVSNAVKKTDTSGTATNSFDNILNKVSDNLVQSKVTDTTRDVKDQVTNAKAQNSTADAKASAKNDVTNDSQNVATNDVTAKDTAAVETTSVEETTVSAELNEAIEETGEEIISQIAETLDLSEEEIVNAMQILGLMASDLLNPASMQQLVTELAGQGEAVDLITDSDIYTSLQDLMEGAESMKMGLMNEFDLSEEELDTALDEFKGSFKNTLEKAAETAEIPVVSEEAVEVSNQQLKTEVKAPVSEVFDDRTPVEEKPVEITVSSSKEGETKGNLQNGGESLNLFNQVMNNIADAAAETDAAAQASYTDRAQMEDIIRQITDKITISAKAEETSMELQLHPASLGNVNILLTSGKDGIVAKFTAQNQIVKEAVESQMMQLQQKFDEQGIKITSIEVTIASHGFEQNLDQQGDRNGQETAEGKKARGLRRINLTELKDDEEPESEAEKIAVQMMEANGNSVDFSA